MQQPSTDSQRTQPPTLFLQKLWKIVEDQSTNDIISWNSTGDGFVIENQAKFAFQILPKYYNHSNLCSFIRQLNMYGFRKVLLLETKDSGKVEYAHRYFSKDQQELMSKIERKLPTSKTCNNVLKDFEQIQGQQVEIDAQLAAMKQENGLLWREIAVLRQKHLQQQELVNKIIEFLVAVIQSDRGKKRRALVLESPVPAKKTEIDRQSCENGSAVVLLSDSKQASESSQADDGTFEEFRGILKEWNGMAEAGSNFEDVLDFDQLIAIDEKLAAAEEAGRTEEVVLDSSNELLAQGPSYLDL